MLRLLLASLAGAGIAVAGVAVVGDSYYELLGVAIVAMFVGAALAPDVFFRGEWPGDKPDRADRS